MLVFIPIVEGQGEVQAVPALLHRLAQVTSPGTPVRVNPPIRVKSGSFLSDPDYFRRHVSMAAAKAQQLGGHVLILLDSEDHCPARLGPELLRRAQEIRRDVSMGVFLAYREYETWFIAAAESLRGLAGLPANLEAPPEPERFRNAKGWLTERMARPYDPILHQLEFTRVFDLEWAAQRSESFRRLRDAIEKLTGPPE